MDFFIILVIIHIGLGEFGGLCFLWVAVETFNRKDEGLRRAKIASTIGAISAVSSWFAGGYYYVKHYGTMVKPVLIAETSTLKWAHKIVIEAKEHIFLLIPILAVTAFLLFFKLDSWKDLDEATSKKVAYLALLIFLMVFLMAAMGSLVSGSVRSILGAPGGGI
ncbi:MAG: hypothetical protein CVV49_19095 [Spirochaetae bacterium HGW-Spirochaetae-5]|nr:MAG: hypothetical protein CVV49_19095 [Spirochaetae bacterium HGW-Spirochaetae-5]